MKKTLEGLASSKRVGELGRVVWGLLGRPPARGDRLAGSVQDVMTRDLAVCSVDDPLSRAAQIMWDRDCGVVPVLDAAQKLVGVVTDRDLCMACLTQGRVLADIRVSAVVSGQVYSCAHDASLDEVASLMARHGVRRLVVLDEGGGLAGLVALADIARHPIIMAEGSDSPVGRGSLLALGRLLTSLSRPWRNPGVSATTKD